MTMPRAVDVDELVHARERLYFVLLVVASLAIYAWMATLLVSGTEAAVIVMYAAIFALLFFWLHAISIGRIRGNAVRVGARQFPELHRLVEAHSRALGLAEPPDVFLMQAGGVLNAFATRFMSRNFVVLFAEVVELAEERGQEALSFIVAHELGHVVRGHLRYRWLTAPGRMVPYLGSAWSRACEFTCDRIAAACAPQGAVDGLLVLAAGARLYRRVDAQVFADQVDTESGFWTRRAEIVSTHPHLATRVTALLAAGVPRPASPTA